MRYSAHNVSPDDRFEHEVHVESHRRWSEDQLEIRYLEPQWMLTRMALIETVELPIAAKEIRDELAIFSSEIDVQGLAEYY